MLCKLDTKFGVHKKIPASEGFSSCLRSKNISNQYYKVYFIQTGENHARLGIIASKKCIAMANQRNKNKRAIREIFRTHAVRCQSLDIVVLVRNYNKDTFLKQKVELKSLFDRLEAQCAFSS